MKNELQATSDEKQLYFRNKSAGSSNYRACPKLSRRRECFLLPEFTLDGSSLAFLSGAVFLPPVKRIQTLNLSSNVVVEDFVAQPRRRTN